MNGVQEDNECEKEHIEVKVIFDCYELEENCQATAY